jgi:hypothetical protein
LRAIVVKLHEFVNILKKYKKQKNIPNL